MRPPRLLSGVPPSHQAITIVGEISASVDLDPYLSLRSTSSYIGLSVRSLRAWLIHPSRPLPCFRIGGKILCRRSELDRWAENFRHIGRDDIENMVNDIMSDFQSKSNKDGQFQKRRVR